MNPEEKLGSYHSSLAKCLYVIGGMLTKRKFSPSLLSEVADKLKEVASDMENKNNA